MSLDAMDAYVAQLDDAIPLVAREERRLSELVRRGHEADEVLDDPKRHRRLSDAKVVSLMRVRDEGAGARDRLIGANLRLVISIAKRYPLPTGTDMLDLVQEGNIGLERAAQKFDGRKGFKFSVYATFWIRNAIERALDQRGNLIKVPGYKMTRLRSQLAQSRASEPSLDAESARLLLLTTPTSINADLAEDTDESLDRFLADTERGPEQELLVAVEADLVRGLLAVLRPRQRYILEQYYGIGLDAPMPYICIAEDLGVTVQTVRKTVRDALRALREHACAPGEWSDLRHAA